MKQDDIEFLDELRKKTGIDFEAFGAPHAAEQLIDYKPAPGLKLPWHDTSSHINFELGSWTIWSGKTFAGKTQLLRQLAMHGATSGIRCAFMSLEERMIKIRREFVFMAAHTRKPEPQFVEEFVDWMADRLYIIDCQSSITPLEAAALASKANYKHDVQHIFIDSLMRLDMRHDDYEGQRELGNVLSRVCRLFNIHIHLVIHPTKAANSADPIDLFNISGSGHLLNQADNIITFDREPAKEKSDDDATNVMTVWKQRGDVDWIGQIPLWYRSDCRQFVRSSTDKPMEFMHWDQYPAEAL